jgi:hypothetical protein
MSGAHFKTFPPFSFAASIVLLGQATNLLRTYCSTAYQDHDANSRSQSCQAALVASEPAEKSSHGDAFSQRILKRA